MAAAAFAAARPRCSWEPRGSARRLYRQASKGSMYRDWLRTARRAPLVTPEAEQVPVPHPVSSPPPGRSIHACPGPVGGAAVRPPPYTHSPPPLSVGSRQAPAEAVSASSPILGGEMGRVEGQTREYVLRALGRRTPGPGPARHWARDPRERGRMRRGLAPPLGRPLSRPAPRYRATQRPKATDLQPRRPQRAMPARCGLASRNQCCTRLQRTAPCGFSESV